MWLSPTSTNSGHRGFSKAMPLTAPPIRNELANPWNSALEKRVSLVHNLNHGRGPVFFFFFFFLGHQMWWHKQIWRRRALSGWRNNLKSGRKSTYAACPDWRNSTNTRLFNKHHVLITCTICSMASIARLRPATLKIFFSWSSPTFRAAAHARFRSCKQFALHSFWL